MRQPTTRQVGRERSVVEARSLSKQYRSGDESVHIFKDLSFSIQQGDFFAIVGVSGSGKTTLLNVLSGLDVPTSGEATVCGEAITALGPEDRASFRREHLGFVFQFYNLMPTLTAEENVKLGLELLRLSRSEMSDRAAHYLGLVGLRGKEGRFPNQLSGGEQQRVAIARALAKHPSLVLADEPTGSLDRATGRSITAVMREATEWLGTTVVVVTHDEEITTHADGVLRLDAVESYLPVAGTETV